MAPVATEESYFLHPGRAGTGDPAGTDHFTGRGRSPELKGTVMQRTESELFSLIPRRRIAQLFFVSTTWSVV